MKDSYAELGARLSRGTARASREIEKCITLLRRYKYSLMKDLYGNKYGKGGNKVQTLAMKDILRKPGNVVEGKVRGVAASGAADLVPVVTGAAVRDLRFRPEHCRSVDRDTARQYDALRVGGGDIVMVKKGDAACRCAIIPVFHPGVLVGRECLGLMIDPSACNPFYLNNMLHHWLHTGYLRQRIAPKGTVKADLLLSLPVVLPTQKEQQRVADLLLSVSARIVDAEEAERMISRAAG